MAHTAAERREELKGVWEEARGCVRCPQLAETRTQVVFGSGNADAELMFVGEAPGANEDGRGLPFVGQAGQLLDALLAGIGLARGDVFVANVLKCLRYSAPVQLGDGSWERIGRLVRTGYAGTVMSVLEDGTLAPRRVTGWHASPLGERAVFRLSFRSAKPNGLQRAGIFVTGDHEVLTQRGYVAVERLEPDDRMATGQGMSDVAFDVICGSLLGDASIGRRQSNVTFSHSARQSEYAAFKASLLSEFETRAEDRLVRAVAGGPEYSVVHTRTLAHRALRILRNEFYGDVKLVPDWLEVGLNQRMLAFWFMDDGYMRIRSNRRPLAEIATVSFSDGDLQTLIGGLANLGLAAKASRSRLYFDVDSSARLARAIAPFVPPSMRYKLTPEAADQVPFDPARFAPSQPRVLFDEVDVEDVSGREFSDRTWFCLDVEESHNFVTAGGVVHNCRPPGNRDPLPGEIENCSPYLERQLALIQPKVVCTLGNFATKLLRDDQTGITRLRGRAEERVLFGARNVRLLPLLHPAAALYTPAMRTTLEEDFALIPDLLALPALEQPEPELGAAPAPEPEAPEPEAEAGAEPDPPFERPEPEPPPQLGLF